MGCKLLCSRDHLDLAIALLADQPPTVLVRDQFHRCAWTTVADTSVIIRRCFVVQVHAAILPAEASERTSTKVMRPYAGAQSR